MQLVIAEKPAVARDLARVLGVPASGAHAFEGDRHVITWCVGHLVELDEPAAHDPRWKAWRLDTLPMLPPELRLRPARHAVAHLRAVVRLLRERRFTSVVNACDAGREGELIFRYVVRFAGGGPPVRRLWISSLTDDAIRRGLAALRPGADFDALGDAAQARSEADWLVGMNATRAVTVRGRSAGGGALYSVGRVQTPTLAMLVEREQAIRAFVPAPYWEVRGGFRTADGATFTAGWRCGAGSRLATAALADAIVTRDRAHGAAADPRGPRVERVRARVVREPPPLLFDLTSLQRTANRRFGWSAARTLELAQALYERHKVLTYPRTDSRHLTADVARELPDLFAALATVPVYAPFAGALVRRPPQPGRRVVDDRKVHDHHAIIPTGKVTRLDALDRDEARLFDLVVRRFLGAFFPDAELAITDVWIRVGGAGDRPGDGGATAATRARPGGAGATDRSPDAGPAGPAGARAGNRAPPPEASADRVVEPEPDCVGRAPQIGAEAGGREAAPAARSPAAEVAEDAAMVTVLPPPPDRYLARGRTRLVAGWQEVAGIDGGDSRGIDGGRPRGAGSDDGDGDGDREDAEPSAVLPPLVEGQALDGTFASVARQTKPPPRYTEATLLGAMESAGKAIEDEALRAAMKDCGLGTPATRAAIIETLLARGYVERVRRQLAPTALGIGLVEALPVASLASPELTGAWERRLARIARGEETRAAFMADISRYVGDVVKAIRAAPAAPLPRPAPRETPSAPAKAAPNGAPRATPNGAPREPSKTRATKKPRATKAAVTGPLSCPRCRQGTLLEGKRGWGCSRWREGCTFVVWFEVAGRRISDAELGELVSKGKTRKRKWPAADGAERNARLVLDLEAPRDAGAARLEETA
ncbi:MAG TPA: DNA topoisomerase [Kofleriaceae bacterium]|nr:DNA topoisomerase [Kofleriaceae bacterium]